MATGNTDFGVDGILATTISHYIKKLEEQAFKRTVLLHILREGGMPSQNGESIVQPLLYGETSAKGSFADDDVFDAPTRDGITAAEFPWRQYYASIVMTGLDKAKNSGREQILSLLKARLTQAELSIAKDVNSQLFSDGSGNANKDFDGLGAVFSTTNTYGGIDRTDANNNWWHPQIVDHLSSALTLAVMRTAYNNVMDGVDKATHSLTTQDGYEAYEGLLQSDVRHESTDLGDAGFDSLMFKSTPIVFDRVAPVGEMFFLNANYLEFVTLDGKWFDVSDWLRPTNQDAMYKNILLYGNLTVKNSDLQGQIINISDA